MVLPFELRDYQQPPFAEGIAFAEQAEPLAKKLYASPTGTGKSYLILALLAAIRNVAAIVPNASIMMGLLEKLKYPVERIRNEQELYALCNPFGIYTPLIYKARLLSGDIEPHDTLLIDEAHHDNETADTGSDIDSLTHARKIGFTATPWQGTPAGSYSFLKRWGEPRWILRIKEAVSRGVWTLPKCETWALVNDDEIEVQNGQLVASQVTSAYNDKIDDVLSRIASDARIYDVANQRFAVPTIITAGSTGIAKTLTERAGNLGMPVLCITQETTYAERRRALSMIYAGVAIVQIRTIGEGTDVHARCMIDLAPTLSPVLWFQRFGRLTRPGGESLYICTNLNYSRHCYLLEGVAPELYLREAIAAFGGLSERTSGRAFGLQSLGRLRATRVKLLNGLEVHYYGITANSRPDSASEDVRNGDVLSLRREYAVIVHPNLPNPIAFAKESKAVEGTMQWGQWERTELPPDLKGFKSSNPAPLSQGQHDWWLGKGKFNGRGAAHYGIDPEQKVNARIFSLLPIVARHKIRLA